MVRPSHSTVVAYSALFVALGGSAYAAATIGPGDIKDDAVLSRHVKNGAVKKPDIGPNSIGSGKVIDGSLLKQDFKAGQLPRGQRGATGPRGPGAISFSGQFDYTPSGSATQHRATFEGFDIYALCADDPFPVAGVGIQAADSGYGFYAWGNKTQNGTLSNASASASDITASGPNSSALDVVAEATVPGEAVRWVRFDLTVIRGSKCNFHGMVTPSTPVG